MSPSLSRTSASSPSAPISNHVHEGEGKHLNDSVFQQKTRRLATSFFASVQSFCDGGRDLLTFQRSDRNVVYGQKRGIHPRTLVAEQENLLRVVSLGSGHEVFLSKAQRQAIKIESLYPEEVLCKVGLLRAPKLKEEKIKNFDYNLAMAKESLVLGAHLYKQVRLGSYPHVNTLWFACRAWRVGRLDSRTKSNQIEAFTRSRFVGDEIGFYMTPIASKDIRYSHLIELMRQHAIKANGNESLINVSEAFRQRQLTLPSGKVLTLLSLQNKLKSAQGDDMPLTEIRVALNSEGQPVRSSWANSGNAMNKITSTDFNFNTFNLDEGLMLHTDEAFIPALMAELDSGIKKFLLRFAYRPFTGTPDVVVKRPDFASVAVVELLRELAKIHYLLAQTALDLRGSAAKSELLVRSLAVAAGIELPPFKSGFVPDLESFVLSADGFVESYLQAFER